MKILQIPYQKLLILFPLMLLVFTTTLAIAPRPLKSQTGGDGCAVAAIIVNSPDPTPARAGDTVTARVSARPDDPKLNAECALTRKSCAWDVTKVEFRDSGNGLPHDVTTDLRNQVSVIGDGVESPAQVVAQSFPAGYWNLTLTVTASWLIDKQYGCNDCDCGSCSSAKAELSISFVVVGVDLIVDTDDDPEGDSPDDTQPLQKFVGLPFQLRAVPYPADAQFPAGNPVWSVQSRASGSNLSPDIGTGPVSESITPDAEGTYSISATCGADQKTVQVDVTAVRVRALLYQDGRGNWKYPESGGTWVLKGTPIKFKAISTAPRNDQFPPGQPVWSGAATGTGNQVTVTFDTTSPEVNQPSAVSVTCTNTVSANYVVCEIEGIVAPTIHFKFRSETRLGIGETAALSARFTPRPVDNSIPFALEWRTKETGAGTLTEVNEDETNGTAVFNAGMVASDSSTAPQVRLVVKDGPSEGRYVGPYPLTVVAPEDGYMVKISPALWHDRGNPSVGFIGEMYLLPDDVSFSNINFREGGGKCKATGTMSFMNGKNHPTSDAWMSIITDPNESAGEGRTNRVSAPDWVAIFCDFAGPRAPATLDWPIVWEYQGLNNTPVPFTIARMIGDIDAALTATLQKAGAGPFSLPNGPPDSVPNGWLRNYPYPN